MFGIVKPAHVQMRAVLPPPIARDFDAVLANVEGAIPTYYEKGARERGLGIIMGNWIEDRVLAGDFSVTGLALRKVAHLVELCERFNARDMSGDGMSATVAARDVVRALREAYAEQESVGPSAPAQSPQVASSVSAAMTDDELERRKRSLDERLRVARGS